MKTTELQPVSASIAVLLERPEVDLPSVVTVLRDDYAHISNPGLWEVPGGGIEPEDGLQATKCATRELSEELNILLNENAIIWSARYEVCPGGYYTFHVAKVCLSAIRNMQLGNEGQECTVMPTATFLRRPDAVKAHKAGLSNYLTYVETGAFTYGNFVRKRPQQLALPLPYWWQYLG